MRFLVFALLTAGLFWACESGTPQIQTTADGNRYLLYPEGSGEVAAEGEYIYFHVSLRTEGDSIMGSTRDNGGEAPAVQVAAADAPVPSPVEDIVRLMRAGDSVVIRQNIAEIPNKPPGMENDTVVLYTVQAVEIVTEEQFAERKAAKDAELEAARELVRAREEDRLAFAAEALEAYNAGTLENIQETETGLKYVIHEEGDGAEAEAGKGVAVQYIGQLVSNGNVFDQSFGRGEAIRFPLGQRAVIAGWDEGIDLLQVGDKATFFIPAELGYGAQGTPDGSIPADSELAFYVELEEVQ
ncbi:MAG: FKBP-type peptidyl-prolyl cis-trans isomerase [Bacteroidota bacterium]